MQLLSYPEAGVLHRATAFQDKLPCSRATAGPVDVQDLTFLVLKQTSLAVPNSLRHQGCSRSAVHFFTIHPSPGLRDLCQTFDVFLQVID